MLSVEQYSTLLGSVPAINKELRKHGVSIGDEGDEADAGDENDIGESDEAPAKSVKEQKSAVKKPKGKKANIEATSDEAEDVDDSE